MNVQVLGDDIAYGGDFLSSIGTGFTKFLQSDTGKVVTTILTDVGRTTPTDKAQIANMQTAAGLDPQALNNGSRTQVIIPQASTLDKSLPYIIIGGSLLIGAILLFSTKRPRTAV